MLQPTAFSALFETVHSMSCDESWPKLLLQVVHGTQQPLELAPAEHEDFDLFRNCTAQYGSVRLEVDHRDRRGSRRRSAKRKMNQAVKWVTR